MRTTTELQTILGITRTNYEAGEWGTTNPTFQIQSSIADKFNNDVDLAFNEIAYKAYNYLGFVLPVIDRFVKLEWFTQQGKDEQKIAIFKIIQFWADNNMIKEMTAGSSITTNNFSIQVDSNDTLTIGERIGMDAWTFIQKTSLWRTKVFDNEDDYLAFVKDTNGNYEIIGKFDTDKYPVLN